jgi:hypothetical protein
MKRHLERLEYLHI